MGETKKLIKAYVEVTVEDLYPSFLTDEQLLKDFIEKVRYNRELDGYRLEYKEEHESVCSFCGMRWTVWDGVDEGEGGFSPGMPLCCDEALEEWQSART